MYCTVTFQWKMIRKIWKQSCIQRNTFSLLNLVVENCQTRQILCDASFHIKIDGFVSVLLVVSDDHNGANKIEFSLKIKAGSSSWPGEQLPKPEIIWDTSSVVTDWNPKVFSHEKLLIFSHEESPNYFFVSCLINTCFAEEIIFH